MTVETRTLIELSDIIGLELSCPKCGSRVSYPIERAHPDQFRQRQHHCPNCPADLLQPDAMGPEVNRIADLIEAIKTIVRSETKAVIRLEVAEPQKKGTRGDS